MSIMTSIREAEDRRQTLRQRPHVVYTFRSADGDVLYVGCTSNMTRRLYKHHGKPWWHEVTKVDTTEVADWHLGRRLEAHLIRILSPKYNEVRMTSPKAGDLEPRPLGPNVWQQTYLTTAQVAAILGVSRRQVNRMVARGDLVPAQKLEGQTGAHLFRADAIPAAEVTA